LYLPVMECRTKIDGYRTEWQPVDWANGGSVDTDLLESVRDNDLARGWGAPAQRTPNTQPPSGTTPPNTQPPGGPPDRPGPGDPGPGRTTTTVRRTTTTQQQYEPVQVPVYVTV